MKTYAQTCLERAEKATEGPWRFRIVNEETYLGNLPTPEIVNSSGIYPNTHADFELIAHSRTDVVELARRLEKATQSLRDIATELASVPWNIDNDNSIERIIKELERPLE